ncbi:hypothetical protein OOU_Y34scaffold01063g1 [Pyricularia oryzae Y34]|uniref:Uncharacterized protein n=1 Tax=Pyricularia oryzae (strain Y34) TaxID=1143189 RepID=A0AA97NMA4_PYRO3|nr:hypothetical protein OOU_Y34scaffold01063g1 [Pyricularia oryzae Y34]
MDVPKSTQAGIYKNPEVFEP